MLWRTGPASAAVPSVPGADVRVARALEAALAHKDWCDVLVDGRPSELLDGARLRHVIVPWAGLHRSLRQALLERPHLVAHNTHANAPYVAEHMVALLLALAHRLREADEALRRGDWSRDGEVRTRYGRGARAVLLGYGHIARAAVPVLRSLGLTLTAVRRRVPQGGSDDLGVGQVGVERLTDAFRSADMVLCTLPETPGTGGLVGRTELDALPAGALIVNVGRAAVFDEAALFEALRDRRLGGAALDVWYRYPEGAGTTALPATLPFWELPNVLLSPHRADEGDEPLRARHDDVAATIEAIARGELRARVDVAAGY